MVVISATRSGQHIQGVHRVLALIRRLELKGVLPEVLEEDDRCCRPWLVLGVVDGRMQHLQGEMREL